MNIKRIILPILICLFAAFPLHAQNMEFSSSNPEAAATMRKAMTLMGHDMLEFSKLVEKAHKLDPDMPMPNMFLAMNPDNKEKNQAYIDAVESYDGELNGAEEVFAEMFAHMDEEDYDAVPEASKLAEMYPKDPLVQLMLGFMNMDNENVKGAMSHFEKAVKLGPLPGAHNMMGYGYMQMGKMDKAKESFEAYQAAVPTHYNPHDSMGDYYMAIKDYKSAHACFEKAVSINPELTAYSKEKAEKAKKMMNP